MWRVLQYERRLSNGATGAGRSLLLPDASRSHAAVEAVVTALVLAASGHPANAPIADPEERSAARRVRVCGDERVSREEPSRALLSCFYVPPRPSGGDPQRLCRWTRVRASHRGRRTPARMPRRGALRSCRDPGMTARTPDPHSWALRMCRAGGRAIVAASMAALETPAPSHRKRAWMPPRWLLQRRANTPSPAVANGDCGRVRFGDRDGCHAAPGRQARPR